MAVFPILITGNRIEEQVKISIQPKPHSLWLVVVSVAAAFFPLFFGRIGFGISPVFVGIVLILMLRRMGYPFSYLRFIGLFLLTLIFANIDAITTHPLITISLRLSWVLLGSIIVYVLLNLRSLFHTLNTQKLLIAFLIFSMLQVAWSIQLGTGTLLSIVQRSLFYFLVMWVTVDLIVRLPVYGGRALFYMFTFVGINTAVGLILEYVYPAQLGMSTSFLLGAERSGGLYLNAGGAAFVVSFCSLIAIWLGAERLLSFWSLVLSLGLFLTGLVFTFSTQAAFSLILIVLGIGLTLFSTRQIIKSPVIISLITLLAMITLLLGASYLLTGTAILEDLNLSQDNYARTVSSLQILSGDTGEVINAMERSNRTTLMTYAWRAIQRQPWWGYGTGLSKIEDSSQIDSFRPHNTFLLIWLENGVFMLIFFSLNLLFILNRVFVQDDTERWFRMLLFANLIIFMLARHVLLFYRFLAIILAVIYVLDQISLSFTKNQEIAKDKIIGGIL